MSAEKLQRFYLYGGGILTTVGFTIALLRYWSIPDLGVVMSSALNHAGLPMTVSGLASLTAGVDTVIARRYRRQTHGKAIVIVLGVIGIIGWLLGLWLISKWGMGTPTQDWITGNLTGMSSLSMIPFLSWVGLKMGAD